jgi:hypothetical protein
LSEQIDKAATARSIARLDILPVSINPSPSRTTRENASVTIKPSDDGFATSKRQLLVPRSIAAYERSFGQRPLFLREGDALRLPFLCVAACFGRDILADSPPLFLCGDGDASSTMTDTLMFSGSDNTAGTWHQR